jgi:PPOX class probable F420-dependent enzyme
MIDFKSPFGERVLQRLQDEEVIWLTTVDGHGIPQPRPVWFHWDGETLLILSRSEAAKVRHLRQSPNVTLNFNTDEYGGDVAVLHGQAVLDAQPSEVRLQSYKLKYRAGIQDLGMTFEQMRLEYSVAILVTPTALRGFI